MGDWCVADHFIIGDAPIPTPTWYDRERWAMRVGVIGPGIQLMQTMETWSCQRLAGRGVFGMCAAYDYIAGEACDPFVAGFNYLLAPSCRDDRLFRRAVEELGDEGHVVSTGGQRMLCLRTTYPYGQARIAWKAAAVRYLEDPMAKLVDILLRSEPSLREGLMELVSGLWTAEHGFIHTGHVRFSIRTPWDGEIEWEVTGAHNVLDAPWKGPCAGFSSLQVHPKPVRVALQRWPF
ncbi:hypothetical protein [Polyangium sp. 6x1]|uniref:hypothetical protein n=1 Tax=Polyangium sp. 6x1 TaxID=3042689 RepID=UPI0024825FC2|nr:hypothetical protein [Polyangium sp. 6x1]MDI1448976.1 hypothetical protein [Polyangium sp. 6x1]